MKDSPMLHLTQERLALLFPPSMTHSFLQNLLQKLSRRASHQIHTKPLSGSLDYLSIQSYASGSVDGIGPARNAPQEAVGGLQLVFVKFHTGILEAGILIFQARQCTAQLVSLSYM